MDLQEYHVFRITRDADLAVQEDEGDDLLLVIEKELRKQRIGGTVVRMEINPTMPSKLKKTLMDNLELSEKDVYTVDGLLDLKDLMSFLGLPLPHLKDPTWTSTMPPRLRHYGDELRIPDLNENNKIDV